MAAQAVQIRLNALRKASSASCHFALSTTTLTRISLVLIIAMLMPRSASAPNILRATPVCVRMPIPLTMSTAMFVSRGGSVGVN